MNHLILAIVLTVLQALLGMGSTYGEGAVTTETALSPASANSHSVTAPPSTVDPILVPAEYVFTSEPLTAGEFFHVLEVTGWVRPEVMDEAYRVACGGGETAWGESGCIPTASNGRCHGLFGVCPEWWSWLCPDIAVTWRDPYANAACARQIVLHEEAAGRGRWGKWDAQP